MIEPAINPINFQKQKFSFKQVYGITYYCIWVISHSRKIYINAAYLNDRNKKFWLKLISSNSVLYDYCCFNVTIVLTENSNKYLGYDSVTN